jgi:hypothetical protein
MSWKKVAAEKMLQLHSENKKHIKQARALKLLYKQAEFGLCEVPSSYNELQEKVASLCNQDLNILEKAIDLAGGNYSLGTISSNDPQSLDPSQQFLASMLGEL